MAAITIPEHFGWTCGLTASIDIATFEVEDEDWSIRRIVNNAFYEEDELLVYLTTGTLFAKGRVTETATNFASSLYRFSIRDKPRSPTTP